MTRLLPFGVGAAAAVCLLSLALFWPRLNGLQEFYWHMRPGVERLTLPALAVALGLASGALAAAAGVTWWSRIACSVAIAAVPPMAVAVILLPPVRQQASPVVFFACVVALVVAAVFAVLVAGRHRDAAATRAGVYPARWRFGDGVALGAGVLAGILSTPVLLLWLAAALDGS